MKLLTETKDGCLMVDDVFIDHDNIEWYQAGKVSVAALCREYLLERLGHVRKPDGIRSGTR